LFTEHGAEISSNDDVSYPRPYGHAVVTVAVGSLLLRFDRGRGQFGVEMAAEGTATKWSDWKDVELVRMVLDESEESHSKVRLFDLHDAARLLRAELPQLQKATSGSEWVPIERKANALYQLVARIR
jgi:hypothetical protein